MLQIDAVLSRADDETLSQLIGQTAMKLIMALDPRIATPSNLREIAIRLHSREGLLLSRDSRSLIFDLLKPDQAKILLSVLGVQARQDIYSALKNVSISRNSKREQCLFDFLS